MARQLPSKSAIYGLTYDIGQIGFQFTDDSFVSYGIAYFERWERSGGTPPVTHCFVVVGNGICIEATPHGITMNSIHERMANPHCHVEIRAMHGWTPRLGARVALNASHHLGNGYGYGLILAHAIDRSTLGKLASLLTAGGTSRLVTRMGDRQRREICSQLVADSMNAEPDLHGRGCLALPSREITPQMLRGDRALFG